MQVLKFGGNQIDDPAWLDHMTTAVADCLAQGTVPLLVHGGGKEIGQLQTLLGGEPRWVAGQRVTDAVALQAATLVLRGTVNTRIVAALNARGIDALGLSGVDRGLVTVRPWHHPEGDLGFVGEPIHVRALVLLELLAAGVVPVIAPICSDGSSQTFNVNADVLAGALAVALAADEVVFVSNVPGILINNTQAAQLSSDQIQALLADGTINAGMRPKVEAALQALEQGVRTVRITHIEDLHGGTLIHQGADDAAGS